MSAQVLHASGVTGLGPRCMAALALHCRESLRELDVSFCRWGVKRECVWVWRREEWPLTGRSTSMGCLCNHCTLSLTPLHSHPLSSALLTHSPTLLRTAALHRQAHALSAARH